MVWKESRTHDHLAAALEDALLAGARYALWARLAGDEGLGAVRECFEQASRHELEHAALWLHSLHQGEPPAAATLLAQAVCGERARWSDALRAWARTARAEGYAQLAEQMDAVGNVARRHEEAFAALARDVERGELYDKPAQGRWVCRRCGCIRTADFRLLPPEPSPPGP